MGDFSSAWPNTEEGALQGAQSCKAYVLSRFAVRITASWGAQSHNTVISNRFAFRITAWLWLVPCLPPLPCPHEW